MKTLRILWGVLRAWPVFITDWVDTIPEHLHCGILTKAYGKEGHSWLCPSCDDEPVEEYAFS